MYSLRKAYRNPRRDKPIAGYWRSADAANAGATAASSEGISQGPVRRIGAQQSGQTDQRKQS
jgi:hypothetical protein